MSENTEAMIHAFRRLMLAAACFHECSELAKHVKQQMFTPGPDSGAIYAACISGIITTYARPFMGAEGLGPINEKFQKGFPTPELETLHIRLIELRNKVYAHHDANWIKTAALHPASHPIPSDIFIIIQPSAEQVGESEILAQPTRINLIPEGLPAIIQLCAFQSSRVRDGGKDLLKKLTRGKKYLFGKYTLGEDFP